MMQAAGKRDQRIKIQQKTLAHNAIGETTSTWADVVSLWAEVRPLRGQDFVTANQEQHTIDARFIILTRSGLTTGMRVVWKAENYDITNLIPGTGPYAGTIEIQAVKGVRDGR
jgi:SPP1 family predicted phage head-tail adaptor